jgi:hypothetical protein
MPRFRARWPETLWILMHDAPTEGTACLCLASHRKDVRSWIVCYAKERVCIEIGNWAGARGGRLLGA